MATVARTREKIKKSEKKENERGGNDVNRQIKHTQRWPLWPSLVSVNFPRLIR